MRLDISCESSAQQMIHMKCQVLFSLKNNKMNFKTSSATNFPSILWVKFISNVNNSLTMACSLFQSANTITGIYRMYNVNTKDSNFNYIDVV